MSAGGSKSSGSSSSNVTIPQFLEPFVRQSTQAAGTALTGLTDLIAPTTQTPYDGPPVPLNGVRGPSGPVFVSPQQQAFVDASGAVIAPLQDGTVPGLVQGKNNPVRVVNGQVFGQGSSGTEELFSMPEGEISFDGMGNNLVAGFQPSQVAAQQMGIDRVLSGDMFGSAQDALAGITGGGVDTSAIADLESLGVDPSALAGLRAQSARGGFEGQGALRGLLGGDVAGTDALTGLLSSGLPGASTDALEATARGDFLLGGEGFDAAVDAAVRRAQPAIFSTFGGSGPGGGTGTLAQEAIGQSAIDAFASQYGQERGRQLSAANALGGLNLSDLGRQAGVAESLGRLDLAGTGQQADIASTLAGLGFQNDQIGIDALNSLGGLSLAGNNQLLQQATAGVDADLANQRAQLAAAQMTPGLASADIDLLSRIGNIQQEQRQAELDAPRNALLQLLTAALGGTPVSSLLGENRRAQQQGFEGSAGLEDIASLFALGA